jgi:hypothetical protein
VGQLHYSTAHPLLLDQRCKESREISGSAFIDLCQDERGASQRRNAADSDTVTAEHLIPRLKSVLRWLPTPRLVYVASAGPCPAG